MFACRSDGAHNDQIAPCYPVATGGSPAWSPDGRKIAFVRVLRGDNSEIYVMNADGSNQRRLTRNPAPEFSPGWQRR